MSRWASAIERFHSNIRGEGRACWEWQASKTHDGYGHFYDHKQYLAHRWSYEYFIGPIPDGLTIDHLCRNRSCVNPLHLEAVTLRENVARGNTLAAANSVKTQCPKGHEYSGANLRVGRDGKRYCKECGLISGRASYKRVGRMRRAAIRKAKKTEPEGDNGLELLAEGVWQA